jgi:hypothetical protein
VTYFDFLQDFGEEWVAWTPHAARDSELSAAVHAFEPVDNEAGHRNAAWLKEEAVANHPSTVTHLLVVEGRVDGFVALCSGTAKLSQRHRRSLRHDEAEHELNPRQPVAHVAWIAKHRDTEISGAELIAQAIGIALEVVEYGQGQIALSLDAFDERTADMWRSRYGFRRSQPLDREQGRIPMWRTIMGSPDADGDNDQAREPEPWSPDSWGP